MYRIIFQMLFWLGCRIGELLALTSQDIDFENGTVNISKTYYRRNQTDYVTPPKTESSNRKITIPKFLAEEMKDFVDRQYGLIPEDRIFPITDRAIQKKMKQKTEQAKYAYCATVEALRNAGIDQDYLNTHEVGLLYGNDSSADPTVRAVDTMREKHDTTLCGSGAIFQSMNSTVTMNLGCIFKLRGINMTVSAACASGAHAIGLGALLIQTGLQDMVVCGGAA